MDVVQHELEYQKRIVVENDEWLVIVPFWAIWPYETMILPKKHIASLNHINKVNLYSWIIFSIKYLFQIYILHLNFKI